MSTSPASSAVRREVGGDGRDGDAAGGDGDVAALVAAPMAGSTTRQVLPAMMDMTAMRTAMPKVTCGRMTLGPSATANRSRRRG